MPNEERNLLTPDERIVSPEEWEELSALFEDCLDRDIPFNICFETGRSQPWGSDEVKQGPQGWTLEIGFQSFEVDGVQKLYRSIGELVRDGWKMLAVIATEEHLAGHVEFEE